MFLLFWELSTLNKLRWRYFKCGPSHLLQASLKSNNWQSEVSLIVMCFDSRVQHFCKNSINEHLLKICSIFVSNTCWKVSSVCVTATCKIYQQLETLGKCSVCCLSLWCATFLAVQVLFCYVFSLYYSCKLMFYYA